MGNKPNRFLHAILCLENLSSGLNRAGCALRVGFPSGAVFCKAHHHSAAAFTKKAKNRQERERIISKNSRPKKKPTTQSSSGPTTRARERDHNKQRHTSPPTNDERKKQTNKRAVVVVAAHLERVHALPVLVQVVHQIHLLSLSLFFFCFFFSFVETFCETVFEKRTKKSLFLRTYWFIKYSLVVFTQNTQNAKKERKRQRE